MKVKKIHTKSEIGMNKVDDLVNKEDFHISKKII